MNTPEKTPRERHVCTTCKAVYGVAAGFGSTSFRCRRCGMTVWVRRIPPAVAERTVVNGRASVEGGGPAIAAIRSHARRGRRSSRREPALLANAIFVLAVAAIFALGIVGVRALGSTETKGAPATEVDAVPTAD